MLQKAEKLRGTTFIQLQGLQCDYTSYWTVCEPTLGIQYNCFKFQLTGLDLLIVRFPAIYIYLVPKHLNSVLETNIYRIAFYTNFQKFVIHISSSSSSVLLQTFN